MLCTYFWQKIVKRKTCYINSTKMVQNIIFLNLTAIILIPTVIYFTLVKKVEITQILLR